MSDRVLPAKARTLADDLEVQLRRGGRPERAEGEKAYLKSDLEHLGCSVPVIRKTTKAFLAALPALSGAEAVDLAEALWAKPVFERRMAAVEILTMWQSELPAEALPRIERLVRQCRGWALLDSLVAQLGPWFESLDITPTLDRWAADEDFWMRRAALLADLIPLREGRGDFGRFCRYAESMLEEKEFFIRKAIGWVLRDTSRKRPRLVSEWVLPRAHLMSGVTIREAVKHLPPAAADAVRERYARRSR